MQKLDFELQFQEVESSNGAVPVIIVAAGSSSRMKGADKQFMSLCGIPVLARTLRAFENCQLISEITVVTKEEKLLDIQRLAERYAVSKLKNVVVGGSCREESVRKGIELYKDAADKVLVHDGARPFVSDAVIRRVIGALGNSNSVTCAVRLADTIKRVDENGFVTDTLKREELVAVQTPQGVCVRGFLSATEDVSALDRFTDDTSVMESVGEKTTVVEGDFNNIKITTPEDIARAEGIIGKEW